MIGQAYGVSHAAMGKSTDIDAGVCNVLPMANNMLIVDPSLPLPGFLLKRAMEGTTETATDRTGNRAPTINTDGKSLQESNPGYGRAHH